MKKLTICMAVLTIFFISCEKNATDGLYTDKITESSTLDEDNDLLANLYQEILNLANQYDCVDPSLWDFTAIGSKACGGPTGYIAYSSKINKEIFLTKVEYYTSQQDTYNRKWEVISDCSMPLQPSGIKCVDGKPVFYY